jgi:hypothetical protein
VGSITIGGDFTASSIAAGVSTGADAKFGTNDDALGAMDTLPDIKATIGSIIIKGRANGTFGDGDHFGIVAEQLGNITIGGAKLALTAGTDNLLLGTHSDLRVREV